MKVAAVKKWIPALLAPVVVAAVVAGASISANAQVKLESKTPQQVMEMIAGSALTGFSGEARATLDLGLPKIPSLGDPGLTPPPGTKPLDAPPTEPPPNAKTGTELLTMLSSLSGTHHARIYAEGSDKSRIQVLEGMGEENFIRNGSTLWKYDSEANTAVHSSLPATPGKKHARDESMPMSPGEMANRFLQSMGQDTEISVQDSTRVAGRDAYTLELVPRDGDSLIARVSIGVDAATGAPLEVVVDAVGQQEPAITMGFTSFTPEAPAAELFEFTPPAGASVTEYKLPQPATDHRGGPKHAKGILGSGWESIMVVPAKEVSGELASQGLLDKLSTPVEGGRLVHTSLLNALVTTDGRMLVGPVSVARLQAAANE
ncbi:MAG: hypothetical protein Q4P23_01555 [Micrococcaceae bacterium]|nr:hypothetical protein [Micrococcaceae bacterium]